MKRKKWEGAGELQLFEIQKDELEIGGEKSKVPIERKGNNDELSFLKAERDILVIADREHGIPG